MVSLRNSLTLVRLLRAYTNARRSGRYCYWLGMALVMAFVVGAGVKLARVTADVSSPMIITAPAASFEREVPLAPGSIVVASGANLATRTVSAVDADADTHGVQLPTELGGTTVTINGRMAELFFVGKLDGYDQVNFLMPEGTALGQADIVIKPGDGTTSRGTATIAN